MSIKQIRDSARKALHDHLSDRAVYRGIDGTVIYCTVRISIAPLISDVGDLGGLSGVGNAGFASTVERAYRATFLNAEITPRRGSTLEMDDGTRYRVDQVHPPYGITIDADLELIQ